nr:protein kinase, catalytic domain-containing protein [Tanacetum cinerariifolium]
MASGSDRDAKDAVSKLLQLGMVAEYESKFVILESRVTRISTNLLKSFYILGLKLALQCALLMLNLTTLDEAFSLARATEARFMNLQILKILRLNHSTFEEAFFRARITEARFEDENSQAVDTIVGDQEDLDVKDKQEVKKADDREIKNIKDEEGKNVEDQHDSERDDDTNNDDVGYMRQPIEDESWFLAHEINFPNVNEKKADHRNNKSTQENTVLKGRDVSDKKSREVFSVTPWTAKGGRRVLCHIQGSGKRKRKKSVGCSNDRRACALFGALVFPLFKPGPGSFAHKRIWDPGIKIIVLNITLRTMWFLK